MGISDSNLQKKGCVIYGIHFSQDLALKNTDIFNQWELITKTETKYRILVTSLLSVSSTKIIKKLITFPREMMELAFSYKDHLIYQRFANLYPIIYLKVQEITDIQHKEKICESIIILLIEHRKYVLDRATYINKNIINEMCEHVTYYEDLLVIWNKLLKSAIDHKNVIHFDEFIHQCNQLTKAFYKELNDISFLDVQTIFNYENGDPIYENYIDHSSPFEKEVIKNQISLLKFKLKMFLGIGGWLTHLVETGKYTVDEYLRFIQSIDQQFLHMVELYGATIFKLDYVKEDIFNWDSWVISEWPIKYGEVTFGAVNTHNILISYFVIRSLVIIKVDEQIYHNLIPSKWLAENCQLLLNTLDEISKNSCWLDIFIRIKVCDFQERIDLLKSIFLDLKNKQEYIEQHIIDSSLDQELLKSFKSEVIKQWRLQDGIRKLTTEVGCYREQYQFEENNSSQPLHVSMLLPKEAFIKQTSSNYSIPPEVYSHQITEYEDRFLALLFLVNEHIEVNRENVDDVLMAKYQKMQEMGYTPIIICKNGYPSNVLTKSKNFKPNMNSINNGFNKVLNFGLYRQTPVYVFNGLTDNSLYLIDLQKFGILTQQGLRNLFSVNLSQKYPSYFNNLMTCQHNNVFRFATPHLSP